MCPLGVAVHAGAGSSAKGLSLFIHACLVSTLLSVAPSLPKMALSKKRKVDTESTVYHEKWTFSYLFAEVNGKPVCLVCSQQVSALNEYNI